MKGYASKQLNTCGGCKHFYQHYVRRAYSSYNDIYDHIYDDIYDDIEDSMDDGTI